MFLKFEDFLTEKLITFNNKAYPKSNQVVILAGGAGGGKGFIKKNLLGIEGKTFDVDKLKSFLLKSKVISKKLFNRLKGLDLKNPNDVYTLHVISKYIGLSDKEKESFVNGVDPESINKPNLIFDVTMKDFEDVSEISNFVQNIGYKKENIHIVWTINTLDNAIEQNKNRSRIVPEEILKVTHKKVAATMKEILNDTFNLRKYADGDFFIVFNRKGIDTKITKSKIGKGSYISDSSYIKVKNSNLNFNKNLNAELKAKISNIINFDFN